MTVDRALSGQFPAEGNRVLSHALRSDFRASPMEDHPKDDQMRNG
jgi:hypothetical protein